MTAVDVRADVVAPKLVDRGRALARRWIRSVSARFYLDAMPGNQDFFPRVDSIDL